MGASLVSGIPLSLPVVVGPVPADRGAPSVAGHPTARRVLRPNMSMSEGEALTLDKATPAFFEPLFHFVVAELWLDWAAQANESEQPL